MPFPWLSRPCPVSLLSSFLVSPHTMLSRARDIPGAPATFVFFCCATLLATLWPLHLLFLRLEYLPPAPRADASQFSGLPFNATHSRKRSLISPVDFIFPGYRYLSSPGLFLYVLVTSSVMAGTVCSVHRCLSSPLWSVRVMVGAQ